MGRPREGALRRLLVPWTPVWGRGEPTRPSGSSAGPKGFAFCRTGKAESTHLESGADWVKHRPEQQCPRNLWALQRVSAGVPEHLPAPEPTFCYAHKKTGYELGKSQFGLFWLISSSASFES